MSDTRSFPSSLPQIEIEELTGNIVEYLYNFIEYLHLSGGGARGSTYIGLLEALDELGVRQNLKAVAGTSAGSIAALVIALGYTKEEARTIFLDTNMKSFLEQPERKDTWVPTFIKQGFAAVSGFRNNHAGLSSGNVLHAHLQKLVENKLGNPNATFADLAKKIKDQGELSPFKNIYVMAADISGPGAKPVTLSHEHSPDTPLALAVLASSAFPGAFKPVLLPGNGSTRQKELVDGGLVQNMPCVFHDAKYGLLNEQGENPKVLSVILDKLETVRWRLWGYGPFSQALLSIKDVLALTVRAVMERIPDCLIRDINTIGLNSGNVKTFSFELDDQQKIHLMNEGKKETEEFLQNRMDSVYDIKRYESIDHWLQAKTIDELIKIVKYYEARSKQAPLSETKLNPDEPTQKELLYWVNFLRKYIQFKIPHKDFLMSDDLEKMPKAPTFFINIKSVDDKRYHKVVRQNMLDQLGRIKIEIKNKKREIIEVGKRIADGYRIDIPMNLRDGDDNSLLDLVKKLSVAQHSLKILRDEQSQLEFKLDIKKGFYEKIEENKLARIQLMRQMKLLSFPFLIQAESPQSLTVAKKQDKELFDSLLKRLESLKDQYQELQTEIDAFTEFNKKNISEPYRIFSEKMFPYLWNKTFSQAFQAVFKHVDLIQARYLFQSQDKGVESFAFFINFRNKEDRFLYLIAVRLYFSFKRCSQEEHDVFIDLLNQCYPGKSSLFDLIPPKNFHDLSLLLEQTGQSLLISAYTLEQLLNDFDQFVPAKKNGMILIDQLFSPKLRALNEHSFFGASFRNEVGEISLKSVVPSLNGTQGSG